MGIWVTHFLAMELGTYTRVVVTNLFVTFFLSRHFLPVLIGWDIDTGGGSLGMFILCILCLLS